MYTLLLALIYVAFVSLGLPDSLLGAGWPAMHGELAVPISYMGLITMIISGGTILSSLLSDRMTRKFGTYMVTVGSVFLTAAALLGFSLSRQFWMLLVLAVPYGLGAGAIDAVLNNYVALHYTSRHMSWLHCFWGVGTIVSPFVMSYALTCAHWYDGYRVVALLQLGIGLLLLAAFPVWKRANPMESGAGEKGPGLAGTLKIKGVPQLLIGFFAYCAAEATAMGWSSTYLAEARGVSAEQAAQCAALFYIGMTAGRFLGGFAMNRLGDRRMILLGAGVAACGIVLLLVPAAHFVLPMVSLVIIGLGCAPIYPCIIHFTPAHFGAEHSGAIIGIQMASAYVGATFFPPLFGFLGSRITFGIFPLYLALFLLLMVFMLGSTFRITSSRRT